MEKIIDSMYGMLFLYPLRLVLVPGRMADSSSIVTVGSTV